MGRRQSFTLSRAAAMSGISPRYRNIALTVR